MILPYLIVVCIGALLALIASKLPVNPIIGFKIGYAYMSKRLWIKLNRLCGIYIAIVGLISLALSFISENLGVLSLLIGLYIGIIGLIEYSLKLAEKAFIEEPSPKTGDVKPFKPIASIPTISVIPIILLIILVAYIVLNIDNLPNAIPVHFNIHELPDRYATKSDFILIALASSTTLTVLSIYVELLCIKRPEAFYKPWLTLKSMRRYANMSRILISFAASIAILAFIDVTYYTLHEKHLISLGMLVIITLIGIMSMVAYILYILVVPWIKSLRSCGKQIDYS